MQMLPPTPVTVTSTSVESLIMYLLVILRSKEHCDILRKEGLYDVAVKSFARYRNRHTGQLVLKEYGEAAYVHVDPNSFGMLMAQLRIRASRMR